MDPICIRKIGASFKIRCALVGRKPNPPRLRLPILKSLRKSLCGKFQILFTHLFWYLQDTSEDLKEKRINRKYASFEILACYSELAKSGISCEKLSSFLPKDFNQGITVTIPLDVIIPLVEGWNIYKKAPPQNSLGECFGFEALKGQGSKPMKLIHKKRLQQKDLAISVLTEYLVESNSNHPKSLEVIAGNIALERKVSEETILAAYKKFRPSLLGRLKYYDLI